MNAIEQRARDFASHSYIEDGEIRTYVDCLEKVSYIKGAREQNEIIRDRLIEMQGEYITLELINELLGDDND